MAFNGRYKLESQENYQEFLKAQGCDCEGDNDIITDIYQGSIFRLTKFLKVKTWNNIFTVGEECELQTLDDKTFKTTATIEGKKLKIEFPDYVYTAELVGDTLTEVNTMGDLVSKVISKRI